MVEQKESDCLQGKVVLKIQVMANAIDTMSN